MHARKKHLFKDLFSHASQKEMKPRQTSFVFGARVMSLIIKLQGLLLFFFFTQHALFTNLSAWWWITYKESLLDDELRTGTTKIAHAIIFKTPKLL